MPTTRYDELENPLQIVRGSAAQIVRNPSDPLSVERYAKIILRCSEDVLAKLKKPSLEAELEASIAQLKQKSGSGQ